MNQRRIAITVSLLFVFVIGIVHWQKVSLYGTQPATECRAPRKTQIIRVLDPAHDIERKAQPQRLVMVFRVENIGRLHIQNPLTLKDALFALARLNRAADRIVRGSSFVRVPHWQAARSPLNHTEASFDRCAGAARISDLEFTAYTVPPPKKTGLTARLFDGWGNDNIEHDQVRPKLKEQGLIRDTRLVLDGEPLKNRHKNIGDGDVDDGPTGRWWPPPFFVGFLLSAGGLLLTCYGAQHFEQLGLKGRLFHLWWVPFAYIVVIVGCRLMALDCWWF